MRYIQTEDILKFDEIRGFKPSMDSMSGTIEWNNGDQTAQYLYATPNWEEEGKCPVSIYHEDGEYQDVAVLKFTDMSKEQQITYYKEVVGDLIDVILEKK
tara:strand:- start:54 stop:353 length:300 start_codon:yes stop_codon:yes gene_type:complete